MHEDRQQPDRELPGTARLGGSARSCRSWAGGSGHRAGRAAFLLEDVIRGERATVDVAEDVLVGFAAGAIEHEVAAAQAHDALRVDTGKVEEVEVDDGGDAELAVDALKVAHDDVGRGRVERGHGLVGQDDAGLLGERTSDADALLLAARQVRGTHVGLLDDVDALQGLHRDLDVLGLPAADERAIPGRRCAGDPS